LEGNGGFSDVRTWLPGSGGPYLDPRLAQGKSHDLNTAKGYTQDIFADDAISFLKSDAAREKPFFLEVAYNAPHFPFQPPDKPNDRRTRLSYGPEIGTRRDYIKMVERMDQGIGKLLAALEQSGRAKDTFVIFLSDNGGDRLADNGPLFHGKYTRAATSGLEVEVVRDPAPGAYDLKLTR